MHTSMRPSAPSGKPRIAYRAIRDAGGSAVGRISGVFSAGHTTTFIDTIQQAFPIEANR